MLVQNWSEKRKSTNRNVRRQDKLLMTPLYMAIVKPRCIQTWRLHPIKESVDKLETVHGRATRMIHNLPTQCYEDRRQRCIPYESAEVKFKLSR